MECRLRNMTYSAPITVPATLDAEYRHADVNNWQVDVEYTRGRQLVRRKGVVIGKLFVCGTCWLPRMTDFDLS